VPRWRSPHQLTRRGLVPVPSVRQDTGTETDSPSTTIIQSGRAAPRPPIPSQPRARPTAAFTQPTGSRPGRVSKHGLPNAIVPETGTRLYMATLVQREERERERPPSLVFSPTKLATDDSATARRCKPNQPKRNEVPCLPRHPAAAATETLRRGVRGGIRIRRARRWTVSPESRPGRRLLLFLFSACGEERNSKGGTNEDRD
jgi:hypothetical protein